MLRQIVETSPLAIMIVDAQVSDKPIVYVNAAFEQLTGYTGEETLGRNARFLQGEDRDQEGGLILHEAAQNQVSCTAILRNYRKDGRMFWNEVHLAPIRDADGTVTHFVGRQQDVTARHDAEQALARSEARYHQIFDSNSAVKLVVDPRTGRIADANAAASDFYGYSREQLKTMRIQDINTMTDSQIRQAMLQVQSHGRKHFEFQHRLASGEIRDVDVYSSPVDTPEGQMLHSILIDVTAKRQAERRYRSLFEQSNDAVFIIGLDGRYLQVNQRAAQMLGYSVEELTALGYQETVDARMHADVERVVARLLAGEHEPPHERIVLRKDGSALSVEINTEVVRDADGAPLHFQAVVRDITARKQAQKRAFELALEKERIELLTRFIQNAAHEFRTPLSTICSGAYLMTRIDDPERRRDKARQIETQVSRITKLIEMLLTLIRLETLETLPTHSVNLSTLLESVSHRCLTTYGDRPELRINLHQPLPSIDGDAGYLSQALEQLLDNAYRYTPPDAVITLEAGMRDSEVWVEVRDTGPGILAQDLIHIFETFWRHDQAHTTEGFGLGLSIVRRIVQHHGGTIDVESQVGQGTTFRITLPIAVTDVSQSG
ncbi:MAG: PAS domain S-box protein [Chloroflexi bacterium]|nr:PAS domain S-box protein [Chloroflexota bacterium]